jgi:hypothetical protein
VNPPANSGDEITGLTIKDEDDIPPSAVIALDVNQEKSLTAVLAPYGVTGTVSWESSDAAVTVSPAAGMSATIKGVTGGGMATITLSATYAGTPTPVTKTFTVNVNQPGPGDEILITGLTIKDSEGDVAQDAVIALTVNQEKSLTAVLAPTDVTGTVTWGSNNAAVTVTPATELSATIKGVTGGGTATITVSAANTATITPVTKTFTVNVNQAADPNLLWQWSAAENPWTSLATGGSNTRTFPDYPDVHLRAFGAAAGVGAGDGIKLGASGTDTQPRLAIGQEANTATTASAAITGDFDLSSKLVKVTIDYTDVVNDDSTRYMLRVSVNNNTGTAANSLLEAGNSSGSGISTIASYFSPGYAGGVTGTNAKLPGTSGTVEVIIDPTRFAASTDKTSLQHAFIALHCQNGNAADKNNFVTITGIKIEYLPSGSAGIVITKPWDEAQISGFPAAAFTLSKTESGGNPQTRNITVTGYDTVTWYVDGQSVAGTGSGGLSITLDAANYSKKKHFLTAVVTKGWLLYSLEAEFTVVQ